MGGTAVLQPDGTWDSIYRIRGEGRGSLHDRVWRYVCSRGVLSMSRGVLGLHNATALSHDATAAPITLRKRHGHGLGSAVSYSAHRFWREMGIQLKTARSPNFWA